MLTITSRKALSLPHVEESPSTVTPRLDMLALRILHCQDESTGAGPSLGLSQYHTMLAHVTRRERPHTLKLRVHYGSIPSRRGTSGAGHTPQATPSRRGTRPPSHVEESTSCVCISMSLSNPNHTTHVCLKNTPVSKPSRLVNL